MGSPEYHEYLKSEKWQRFSLDAKLATGGRCQGCDRETWNLHVHHLTYERLGNERASDVWVVCPSCHLKFHPNHKQRVNKVRKKQGKGKIRGTLGVPKKPVQTKPPPRPPRSPKRKCLDLSSRQVRGQLTRAADRFLRQLKVTR